MTKIEFMKNIIKKNKYIHAYAKKVYEYRKNKKTITNFFKTKYTKNALLSYIIAPFENANSYKHTNFYEAHSIALILNKMGYNVDIIEYSYYKQIDLKKYSLIVGFGSIFQKYFESALEKKIVTIYYGAGMHVCHQNHATLKRVQDVYQKKGIWLGKSARFVKDTWSHQTTLVDGIIALGNVTCKQSYEKYFHKKVYNVNAPFYEIHNGLNIIKKRTKKANKHFLWFGSSGLIHKGLDLLLEFFSQKDDLILHICGYIKNEEDFVKAYNKELYNTHNILVYDFVDIQSEDFMKILQQCSFVIHPSCSEGGSASIATVVGNGGLIPIVSKETCFTTGFEINIKTLDTKGINDSIEKALSLSQDEINKMQEENLKAVLQNNSQDRYYSDLRLAIKDILEQTYEM